MSLTKILFLLAAIPIYIGSIAQSVNSKTPTPVKIALFNGYTEGIAFDAAGSAFISQQNNDTVWKLNFPGKPEYWFSAHLPNGHKIMADGTHLLAVAGAVLKISPDGTLSDTISTGAPGMNFRFPNDLALDTNGGFFVTETDESGETSKNQGRIFYVDSSGKTTLAAMNLAYPNGIVIRPNEKTLLVSESNSMQVLQYEISSPGKIRLEGIFTMLDGTPGDQYADGMCLDSEGNLYVAIYQGGMVQKVDTEGNVTEYIPSSMLTTSNVAFGGADNNELFITGGILEKNGKGGLMMVKIESAKGAEIIREKE